MNSISCCLRALPPWSSCSVCHLEMVSQSFQALMQEYLATQRCTGEKQCFKVKVNETVAVLDLILLINTGSFKSEKCTKSMSVVFPMATLLSVLSCIAQVPHRQLTEFLPVLYGFSGHSKQVFFRNHLLLHLLTHTHHSVSLCFTEFTAQTATQTFLHKYMFDVSFSILSQKERLCRWVIFFAF